MTQSETVKDRLTRARSALGWSKQDLAESSGVAAAQISRYEAGRNEPRSEIVAKLARALNVQFDWLAYGRGPIQASTPDQPVPTGGNVVEMDLSDYEITTLKEYAQAKGLTLEMAAREFMRTAMAKHMNGLTLDEGTIRQLERTVRENTKLVEDLVVRVARVEKKK